MLNRDTQGLACGDTSPTFGFMMLNVQHAERRCLEGRSGTLSFSTSIDDQEAQTSGSPGSTDTLFSPVLTRVATPVHIA